ncbi:zinc finger protein 704-like [Tigriopus californicus]|uniref:zinc finger protein 704-like n=1 Tax=Tigriopus californicus TaxID=6832 RepID=UPI0027DA28BF|nr:zinc finger protein 704-like [Tigriopus californicus]
MSTGKRVAKRSILGTKVMVPGQDGLYHPGWIQAVKTPEGSLSDARYAVKFEETKRVFEFCENDILGPGFESVTSKHLLPGQVVFVTHNNREMCGKVVRHDVESQDVLVKVFGGGAGNSLEEETVLLKIEDIRLLESRKSARLVNSDTDFSKLADVSIAMAEKKKIQKGLSSDVPRSDYVQIAGSRKRRTSENLPDDEETLSECSAAMLLMKLSCSPHSPRYFQGDLPSPLGVDDVLSSSGASSFRSLTPSPPLSSSVTDEGIVKDIRMKSTTIYQCTFPGCREQRLSVESIESHVRKEHLKRPEYLTVEEDEDRDHEEEFYYTEIEQSHPLEAPFTHLASLSLADHFDMARPPHEDPNRFRKRSSNGFSDSNFGLSRSLPTHNPSMAVPLTIAPSMGSPGKLILISPPGNSHTSRPNNGTTTGKSPARRPRDGKKCRKVYGLEQRDLWCTQCKWKKACARFGTNASEPMPTHHQSLLISAQNLSSHTLSPR